MKTTKADRKVWRRKFQIADPYSCTVISNLCDDIETLEAENKRLISHIEELKCCQGYAGGGQYGWDLNRLDKLLSDLERGQKNDAR